MTGCRVGRVLEGLGRAVEQERVVIRLKMFLGTETMYRASPQSRQTAMSFGASLSLGGYWRKKDYPGSHSLDCATGLTRSQCNYGTSRQKELSALDADSGGHSFDPEVNKSRVGGRRGELELWEPSALQEPRQMTPN